MCLVYFQKAHLKVDTIKSLFLWGGKITKDRKKMELYKEESKLYGKGWVRDAVVTTGDKKCCGSESPSQQLCIRALFVH